MRAIVMRGPVHAYLQSRRIISARSPWLRWGRMLAAGTALVGVSSSVGLAQADCIPVGRTNTWSLTGLSILPPGGAPAEVNVSWPGNPSLSDAFSINFTLTRDGPAIWDLGCGPVPAASAVTVSFNAGLGSTFDIVGSGVAEMIASGTGPFFSGILFQHLLVGPGTSAPSSSMTFSPLLAPGTYTQECALDGHISGPGGSPPQPGAPTSASARGVFGCPLPFLLTSTTTTVVMQLVPEPAVASSLALALALIGGWRLRRRP